MSNGEGTLWALKRPKIVIGSRWSRFKERMKKGKRLGERKEEEEEKEVEEEEGVEAMKG